MNSFAIPIDRSTERSLVKQLTEAAMSEKFSSYPAEDVKADSKTRAIAAQLESAAISPRNDNAITD
jgi:hypothetical protein